MRRRAKILNSEIFHKSLKTHFEEVCNHKQYFDARIYTQRFINLFGFINLSASLIAAFVVD